MNFLNYIVEEGLVMILALYIIGEIIKGTGFIENKWIPLSLTVLSIVFTPLFLGAYTPDNIVQAVLITGATVYGNELIKQTQK